MHKTVVTSMTEMLRLRCRRPLSLSLARSPSEPSTATAEISGGNVRAAAPESTGQRHKSQFGRCWLTGYSLTDSVTAKGGSGWRREGKKKERCEDERERGRGRRRTGRQDEGWS